MDQELNELAIKSIYFNIVFYLIMTFGVYLFLKITDSLGKRMKITASIMFSWFSFVSIYLLLGICRTDKMNINFSSIIFFESITNLLIAVFFIIEYLSFKKTGLFLKRKHN